jgi:predicted sugar kinase
MSTPGLKIESAASVILEDTIKKHMHAFAHVIRRDRVAGMSVSAAYTGGLSGTLALIVAGGHASKEEVLTATIAKLREAVDRDLRHLAGV